MWSDNESDLDMLGYQHLVATITTIVKTPTLLPATIGVFGDWGSGKSSLLQIAKSELEKEQDSLILSFNGWLFEGYDDAKSALMGTILEELGSERKLSVKAQGLFAKLIKRINWMRLLGMGTKATVAYSLGGLPALGLTAGMDAAGWVKELATKAKELGPEELEKFIKEKEPEEDPRRSIREFRKDFAELLKETGIKRLVVIIDDLDRCLPATIIETLEAIKLFLFVPNTAFILGADERLVKYAVRTRFPELPGERSEVGRDYLEKLIQYPIRIPPLARPELETYINLLFTRASGIGEDEFEKARACVVNCPPTSLLEVRFNQGIAKKVLKALPQDLEDKLSLAQRIAPVLAGELNGNPRQCKRFLNMFVMRIAMAKSRSIALKDRVLAKLMLLEYFSPESFRRLAELQAKEGGRPAELAEAEKIIRGSSPAKADEVATEDETASGTSGRRKTSARAVESFEGDTLPTWVSDARVKEWIGSDPPLAGEDLRPYFFFSRDRLGILAGAAQRLSPKAQEVLSQVLHQSEAIRGNALKDAPTLAAADATAVFESLAERARQEQDLGASDSAFMRIFDWVRVRPELFGQFTLFLDGVPHSSVPIQAVPKVHNLASAEMKGAAEQILEKWASSATTRLKSAAANTLTTIRKGKG
ncbi:MAG TPA: P-loop NTPase fold protein [Phycisphaerae bacterium]|jgi:hypothetical protein|nr:P-loop NTPase fold protein [Phycisphaerae bacterium]